MDAKRPIMILLIALAWLAAACATPQAGYAPQPGGIAVEVAQATYVAAAQAATSQAQQGYAAATSQAAAATAVAQSTRDMVTLTAEAAGHQATMQAMAVEGTREAIASNATATAVAQVAIVEQRLVADEATRLAIQRERERLAIRNDELWAAVWPWLVGVGVIGLTVTLMLVGAAFMRRSQPMVIDRGQGREPAVLVYSGNGYRQLSEPRITTPDEPPLALPQSSGELPALTSGHALVVGPTDAGKSTALRAIIKARLEAGQQVYVLDPHYEPGSWLDARVIGGGRGFEEIGGFMDWMMQQLNDRARQMAAGDTSFRSQPVTVATDEMPAIVDELSRDVAVVWRKWVREGRKFGLFLAVSTQSTRVKTLGIDGEGDVLNNFGAILYLGQSAVDAYPDLVQQQERPAVLRTMRAAQPVIIPNIQPPGHGHGPILTAPTPTLLHEPAGDAYQRPENVGLSTPRGFVSPTQISQIIEMTQRGESGREIERQVWGYEGGGAYEMRVFVCDQLGVGG